MTVSTSRAILIITSLILINGVFGSAFRTRRELYDSNHVESLKQDDYNTEVAAQKSQQQSSDGNVENITVKVGQQAILPCFVNNLGSHKVIWSKDGDILTLGSTKINSDTRLNIQHRYVSEWHLVIDNVMTDDEGDYNCKTNGNFFKAIKLQVQMPPIIDDAESTPAGTITLKEGSSLNLKCFAEAKPEPQIKWYRWKKYKHLVSEKEELGVMGNEIVIPAVKRGDPNVYECIARNSVPPATSRIFNLETHFLPVVDLEPKKSVQHLHKKFSIECKISSNPIDKVYWSRNGVVYDPGLLSKQPDMTRDLSSHSNIKVEQYDLSDLNDNHKLILTLHVSNPSKQDFGEYKCCASNIYGQTCEEIHVHESKSDKHHNHAVDSTTPSTANNLFGQTRSLKHKKQHHMAKSKSSTHRPGEFFNSETAPEEEKNSGEPNSSSLMLNYEDDLSDESKKNGGSMIEKDKRRHYLINSKQLLNLESQSVMSGSNSGLQTPILITMCGLVFSCLSLLY